MIKDYISSEERLKAFGIGLEIVCDELIEFADHECMGCGQTSEEIAEHEGWNDQDFEENSRTTVEGNWYCHIDCFRDSR